MRPLIDEGPLLLYTDLNNPSETGLVDDAAVWGPARRTATGARRTTNGSAAASDYAARKSNTAAARAGGRRARAGRRRRVLGGAGGGRRALVRAGRRRVRRQLDDGARRPRLPGRPRDRLPPRPHVPHPVRQLRRPRPVVRHHAARADLPRAALAASADGESALVDVVTDGLNCPVFLAVDALWGADGSASGGGLLFWSDPGREAVVRANLDGSAAATVLSLAHPSGIAVDSARAALYVTQQVRGASLIWSDYAGDWQRRDAQPLLRAARPRRRPHRRRGGRRRDGLIRSDVQPGARHRRRRRRRHVRAPQPRPHLADLVRVARGARAARSAQDPRRGSGAVRVLLPRRPRLARRRRPARLRARLRGCAAAAAAAAAPRARSAAGAARRRRRRGRRRRRRRGRR